MSIGEGFARAVSALTAVISLATGGVRSSPPHANGPAPHKAAPAVAGPNIDLYRGLGSWTDIYEHTSWAHPQRAISGMRRHGVRTLYVQTTNYVRKLAIKYPKKQAQFITDAHRAGMKIVAWYLPGLRDLRKDFHRSMKAINFRTRAGDRYDSFALDIESQEVRKPRVRTARLLRLSRRIRAAVGQEYPLGAIIPTPVGMQETHWWPGFPYRGLAEIDDVFLPMTYFTFDFHGERAAHDYTTACIRIIRSEVRDRSVPIHVIGGVSNDSNRAEARGFVHALREQGVIGGSYYAYHGTSRAQWRALERIPMNPVERPALPVSIGYRNALGNLPAGDRTHPKDVVFVAGRLRGSRVLTFRSFGGQGAGIVLSVNWHAVRVVPASPVDAWGSPRMVKLPARLLNRHGPNVVSFTAPRRGAWGVQALRLSRSASGERAGSRHTGR